MVPMQAPARMDVAQPDAIRAYDWTRQLCHHERHHDWLASAGRFGFIDASDTLFDVTGGAVWVNIEYKWTYDAHHRSYNLCGRRRVYCDGRVGSWAAAWSE